jgi:hypothetical protein
MRKPENPRYINQQLARRKFIGYGLAAGVAMACCPIRAQTATAHSTGVNVETGAPEKGDKQNASGAPLPASNLLTLFLCGDVMTGRGVDQVLPHAGNPILYEQYMKSAAGYVELAEDANGSIPKPVEYSYIWGDALAELERIKRCAHNESRDSRHPQRCGGEKQVCQLSDASGQHPLHYRGEC